MALTHSPSRQQQRRTASPQRYDDEVELMLRAGMEARSVLDSLGLTNIASLGSAVPYSPPPRYSAAARAPAAASAAYAAAVVVAAAAAPTRRTPVRLAPAQQQSATTPIAPIALTGGGQGFGDWRPPPSQSSVDLAAIAGHSSIRTAASQLTAEMDEFQESVAMSVGMGGGRGVRGVGRDPLFFRGGGGRDDAPSPLADAIARLRAAFKRVECELDFPEGLVAVDAADVAQLSRQLSVAARLLLAAGAAVQPAIASTARDRDSSVSALATALMEQQRLVMDAVAEASAVAFEEERSATSAFYSVVASQHASARALAVRSCKHARAVARGACAFVSTLAIVERANVAVRRKQAAAELEAERLRQERSAFALVDAAVAASPTPRQQTPKQQTPLPPTARAWAQQPSPPPPPLPLPPASSTRILSAWAPGPATEQLETKRGVAAAAGEEKEEAPLLPLPRVAKLLPPPAAKLPPPTPPGLALYHPQRRGGGGANVSPHGRRSAEWNAWSRLDALRDAHGAPFDGEVGSMSTPPPHHHMPTTFS